MRKKMRRIMSVLVVVLLSIVMASSSIVLANELHDELPLAELEHNAYDPENLIPYDPSGQLHEFQLTYEIPFDELMEGDIYQIEPALELVDEIGHTSAFAPFRNLLLPSEIELNISEIDIVQGLHTGQPGANLVSDDAEMRSFSEEISPLNTNPNLAIFIPDSLFGLALQDLANHQERWYNFIVPANRNVSVVLSYQSGIYDLYLFRLNGSMLQLVDLSVNGGGFERINYLSQSGGVYFLAVAPFIPTPTPHLFSFAIGVNDFRNTATARTNSIDLQANLNNIFSEDWYRLDVTSGGFRDIAVRNAPVGHYAVVIYDNAFNVIGSFFADNTIREMNFAPGTYFIRVFSFTGQRVNNNYRLIVTNANQQIVVHNGIVHFITRGDTVRIVNNRLFALSIRNGRELVINGRVTAIDGARYRYINIFNPPIDRRSMRSIILYRNSTIQPNGFQVFRVNNDYYNGYAVAIETRGGSIHDFDNRRWPMSVFFTTHPSPIADNNIGVVFIRIFVSLETGRVVHSSAHIV